DLVGAGGARGRCGTAAAAAAAPEPEGPAERRAPDVITQGRAARQCRLVAALPPIPDEAPNNHHQRNLQEEPDEGSKPADPSQETMAEQHAQETGPQEPRKESAEESWPAEEAAERRCGRSPLPYRPWLARLGHAALDRPRGRRGCGRRRRGECLRAAAAKAA